MTDYVTPVCFKLVSIQEKKTLTSMWISHFSLSLISLSFSFLPSLPPSFLLPSPPMLRHHRQDMSVFIVYESFWNPGPIHCARLCSALTRKLAFDKFLNLIFLFLFFVFAVVWFWDTTCLSVLAVCMCFHLSSTCSTLPLFILFGQQMS